MDTQEKWKNWFAIKIAKFHKKDSPGKRIIFTLDESVEFAQDFDKLFPGSLKESREDRKVRRQKERDTPTLGNLISQYFTQKISQYDEEEGKRTIKLLKQIEDDMYGLIQSSSEVEIIIPHVPKADRERLNEGVDPKD